jgi:hypothetical protein
MQIQQNLLIVHSISLKWTRGIFMLTYLHTQKFPPRNRHTKKRVARARKGQHILKYDLTAKSVATQ